MDIGIVGLGLIGGSFARALTSRTDHRVLGWNRTRQTALKAKLIGAIHEELTDENIERCDAVIIGLYPDATVKWLEEHAHKIKKGAIVIDTCGVKMPVCGPCWRLAAEHGFSFIGGHPMAGVEHFGFDYSTADMFVGASMILVPPTGMHIGVVAKAKELVLSLGFAQAVIAEPDEHDRLIAYTSQMAHVVSSAYVQSPCSLKHKGFSAGSYRDMTRVSCLNEDMWTGLFLDNAEPLADELDQLIERLTAFSRTIRQKDERTLHEMLRAGRAQKEKADGKVL